MDTAYTWTCLDAAGASMTDPDPASGAFPDQAEAEAYVGQEWEALAAAGVEAVTLCYGTEVVYGPMSLRPAT
ncbi:MAG: hypothetical protein ACR2FV_14670 [Ornithinimicrobium sp.]|uniref:hypothetical protein n=1 Tax=Ornithinimicrobium sp. TaxID=1977084 RepID=UPI003D9AB940